MKKQASEEIELTRMDFSLGDRADVTLHGHGLPFTHGRIFSLEFTPQGRMYLAVEGKAILDRPIERPGMLAKFLDWAGI